MKLVLFLFSLLASGFAQIIVESSQYTFPRIEPLKAAVSTSFIGTPNGVWSHIKMGVLPFEKRRRIRNFRDDERIHFRYLWRNPNNDKKELVYILAGFGANAKEPKANHLARALVDRGFHAIVLPSIFTRQFVIAASSEGVVGEFERDAWDYFRVMRKTTEYVERNFNQTFLKRHMVGYSYGALTAAFVARIDKTENFLNLSKEVLINPPTDLLKATKVLDKFFSHRINMGTFRFLKLLARVGALSLYYRRRIPSPETYLRYLKRLNLSPSEKMALVGWNLQSPLPSVTNAMFAALYHDHGDQRGIPEERPSQADEYYFKNFLRNILLPYSRANHRPEDTLEKINQRNSLYALEEYFKANKNVYVIHNKDDFLLQEGDVEFLSNTLADRFLLYPWGGHLGNIWHSQNMDALAAILEDRPLSFQGAPDLLP